MRFQPDSWLEWVLRPLAMAAPDANVYTEIMAPDFRWLFALFLLAAVVAVRATRARATSLGPPARTPVARPVALLACALAAAFVPWLATTGNGRYFMPALLAVGPLCAGLVQLLPLRQGVRLSIMAALLAVQAFAVQQSDPWQAWKMVSWKEAPYFQVDLPEDVRTTPATYVTMSAITYSALAPMFHPDSRWINLHNAPAITARLSDSWRTEAFLKQAQPGRLMLLVPVVAGTLTDQRLPNAKVSAVFDGQLAPYRLRLSRPQSCRFLKSASLAQIGLGRKTEREKADSGFWLCALQIRDAGEPADAPQEAARYDAVFRALEAACPRYFPAGGDRDIQLIPGGEVRSYHQGEMKAYVQDSGDVYYKYYRALNPVRIGSAPDVVSGKAKPDCANVRGRAVLPWNREL